MSLWGRTVITNMLSAIPWIGQDFVEFHKILSLCVLTFSILIIFSSLPTIGTVNTKALRGIKARTDEEKLHFLNIPYDFLSMFIGFVDGDGYISITKTPKGGIRLQLVISLEIADLELLKYFQTMLGGIGRINRYPKINTVKYIISRVDLQEVLIPLLLHHNLFFLTRVRRGQFDRMIYILTKNITKFSDIPSVAPSLFALPSTAAGYLKLRFFLN